MGFFHSIAIFLFSFSNLPTALESIGERNKKIIQILMENNLHTIALQFILQVLF